MDLSKKIAAEKKHGLHLVSGTNIFVHFFRKKTKKIAVFIYTSLFTKSPNNGSMNERKKYTFVEK